MTKNKKAEVLPAKKKAAPPMSTFASADMLIQAASKNGSFDVEKLDKLLTLKGKYEKEENRKRFHTEFANMQSDLPVIQKTKEIKDSNGRLLYKYAPLEKIVEQIKPVLKQYGFSYRWSEGVSEDKSCKRIVCHIMAYGHEETNYVDIPIMEANRVINKAQQAGSVSTYGKRYSLIGALGIMADEDTDCYTGNQPTKPNGKPPLSKGDLVDQFRMLYAKYCEYMDPSDKLKEFVAQVDLLDVDEIQKGVHQLQAMLREVRK